MFTGRKSYLAALGLWHAGWTENGANGCSKMVSISKDTWIKIKNKVIVFMKNMATHNIESMAQQDKMLFKIALEAINHNVNGFAYLVMNLFHSAATADKKAHGQGRAIYECFLQLNDIMRSLVI